MLRLWCHFCHFLLSSNIIWRQILSRIFIWGVFSVFIFSQSVFLSNHTQQISNRNRNNIGSKKHPCGTPEAVHSCSIIKRSKHQQLPKTIETVWAFTFWPIQTWHYWEDRELYCRWSVYPFRKHQFPLKKSRNSQEVSWKQEQVNIMQSMVDSNQCNVRTQPIPACTGPRQANIMNGNKFIKGFLNHS